MKTVIVNDYVGPIVSSEVGNFWTYMLKELPAIPLHFAKLIDQTEEGIKKELDKINPDLVICNDLWGFKFPNYFTMTILQNPYVDMKRILNIDFSEIIWKQKTALINSNIRVAVSNYIADSYKDCGNFEVISIGVDPNLFKPMDKINLRVKYSIPLDANVKIWVGSNHPVKGFDLLDLNKDFWILVFKDFINIELPNARIFCKVTQEQLAELYNCADVFVSRSRCESLGLAPIEAMFCGIPVDTTPVGIFWDWKPPMKDPKREAFERGLDKATCIKRWRDLIENCRNH